MQIISREIINRDMTYDGNSYVELCSRIDRWKTLLVKKYDAAPGKILTLAVLELTLDHVALVFATAELGMKLLIMDRPVNEHTIHMTKMALFGPADITVDDHWVRWFPHNLMVEKYSKVVVPVEEIESWHDEEQLGYSCTTDDVFLIASTSGSTSVSKPVYFTHREIYEISKRNIEVFKLHKNCNALHSRNMHHASSLLTFFIPALMSCDTHHSAYLFDTMDRYSKVCQEHIIPKQIDRMLCGNLFDLTNLITSMKDVGEIPRKLIVNISGFPVISSLYKYVNELDLEIISHYGSIDTGIPLLVNHVCAGSEFLSGCIGEQPDSFYKMEIVDGKTIVTSDLWDAPRSISDQLEEYNNKWFYHGRVKKGPLEQYIDSITQDYTIVEDGDRRYLALHTNDVAPDEFEELGFAYISYINKKEFTVDTKLNLDQLRAHFRYFGSKNGS